jgi:U3 small nucleolar RNA-associated protein 15
MAAYKKLNLKSYAEIQARETSEAKYWKGYGVTLEEKLAGPPLHIHFNPAANDSYLVTNSTKVSLYNRKDDQVVRSYSRFQDDAYSGRFRKDGKLIIAGDKQGSVKVFDVESKAMLRQLRQHTGAVQTTIWSADGQRMISGGDDKSVKCWDLGTQELIWSDTTSHSDYVRCSCENPSMPHVFASGSYDHSVKLWDSRQKTAVQTMSHPGPIESVVMTASGSILVAACGNKVKLWDLIGGGKLLHTFSNHQKNVSDVALESGGSRLLSVGLDGLLKIYSLKTMRVCHGMSVGTPLLSVALSSDNKKLAMGCVDGTLLIRTRRLGAPNAPFLASSTTNGQKLGAPPMSNDKRFYKGAGAAVVRTADRMVESERRERLRPCDVHLKEFNYQKALDSALHTHNPLVVVTVLEELCRRSGLTTALQGRDERTLEPLLSFAARYVAHPRYASLVLVVTHRVMDLYASVLGHSDSIDELFLKLHRQVRAEIGLQRKMMRVMGTLDGIISTSHLIQGAGTATVSGTEMSYDITNIATSAP